MVGVLVSGLRSKMRLACLLSVLATIFFNNSATAKDWNNLAERRTFELQDFTFHNGETGIGLSPLLSQACYIGLLCVLRIGELHLFSSRRN